MPLLPPPPELAAVPAPDPPPLATTPDPWPPTPGGLHTSPASPPQLGAAAPAPNCSVAERALRPQRYVGLPPYRDREKAGRRAVFARRHPPAAGEEPKEWEARFGADVPPVLPNINMVP